MLHAPDIPTSPAPSGDALFQHWLSNCAVDPWAPLSEAAATPYRFIWGAWLKYLAGNIKPPEVPTATASTSDVFVAPHPWQHAQAVQVLQFLNQTTRSQKQLDLPSDITRRRYWRVLDRIYCHAMLHGWVVANPLDGINAQDRPPSEDPQGAILSPRMWHALMQHIPSASDLITARDRAVLLVLMHLGISSEEVRGLMLDDVVWDADAAALPIHIWHRPVGLTEAVADSLSDNAAPSRTRHPRALRISGSRAMQPRVLELPLAAAQGLQAWLGFRSTYAAMDDQSALFCTRKAPMLSTHTVLHLVSKTLRVASTICPVETPPRMGPQVIRNTVIVQWLQAGLSVDEVLQRSGLKTPHALDHLSNLWIFKETEAAPVF